MRWIVGPSLAEPRRLPPEKLIAASLDKAALSEASE